MSDNINNENSNEKVHVLNRVIFISAIVGIVLFCCFVAGFGYWIEEIQPNLPLV